jgi:hypothetical protein
MRRDCRTRNRREALSLWWSACLTELPTETTILVMITIKVSSGPHAQYTTHHADASRDKRGWRQETAPDYLSRDARYDYMCFLLCHCDI